MVNKCVCLLCGCKLFTPSDISSGYTAPDWPGRAEGAWPCCRWSCTLTAGAYTSRWGCRPWPHPDRGCRVSLPRSRGPPSTEKSLRGAERWILKTQRTEGKCKWVTDSVLNCYSWAFAVHFIQKRPKRTTRKWKTFAQFWQQLCETCWSLRPTGVKHSADWSNCLLALNTSPFAAARTCIPLQMHSPLAFISKLSRLQTM